MGFDFTEDHQCAQRSSFNVCNWMRCWISLFGLLYEIFQLNGFKCLVNEYDKQLLHLLYSTTFRFFINKIQSAHWKHWFLHYRFSFVSLLYFSSSASAFSLYFPLFHWGRSKLLHLIWSNGGVYIFKWIAEIKFESSVLINHYACTTLSKENIWQYYQDHLYAWMAFLLRIRQIIRHIDLTVLIESSTYLIWKYFAIHSLFPCSIWFQVSTYNKCFNFNAQSKHITSI